MKYSKRCKALVGGLVLGVVLCVMTPLNTMISKKSISSKRGHAVQPARYKSNSVWVKTSDGIVMELPQWQIDQMKVLQVLFVHQKEGNSKDNPVDAAMVTSNDVALVQKALNSASNLNEFKQLYTSLSKEQNSALINSAAVLQMQGLTSLLMAYFFPIDVQAKIGATVEQVAGIIAPVVNYLQSPEKIPLNHTGPVLSIALSPDGNRIISGAAGINHDVILYDLKAGKEIKNLVSEIFPVPCVAFSPDGKYIVAGSSRDFDNLILWNGITGEQIKIFGEHPNMEVHYVAFSSDSHYVLAGVSSFDYDNKPVLYDIKSGKMLGGLFAKIPASMSCVAFRPYSKDIVVGSKVDPLLRRNLAVYDSKTYKETKAFVGLSQGEPCIAFSPDGKYLVGATLELIEWDAETAKEIKVFENKEGVIHCVAFDPLGRYIATSYHRSDYKGSDIVVMFSCETGKPVKHLHGLGTVNCVAFSPDGNYLFCGCNEGLVTFKMIDQAVVDYIATKMNIAQARLLYRLYLAKVNHVSVIMDSKEADYQLFKTLPGDVQKEIKTMLPFELVLDIAEKTVLEKMNKYRSSLFYSSSYLFGKSEKKRDEKIKAIKHEMKNLDKNSVAYQACERLLRELEQETAFEA